MRVTVGLEIDHRLPIPKEKEEQRAYRSDSRLGFLRGHDAIPEVNRIGIDFRWRKCRQRLSRGLRNDLEQLRCQSSLEQLDTLPDG